MAIYKLLSLLFAAGAWADSGLTQCPACYTQTVSAIPTPPACPHPTPRCAIVCDRLNTVVESTVTVVTTLLAPNATAPPATVTSSVPGANPACPHTPTVTVTPPGITLTCVPQPLPTCNCARPVTTTVIATVATAPTVYVPERPLTCDVGSVPYKRTMPIETESSPLPTTTLATFITSPPRPLTTSCSSYSTVREHVFCLQTVCPSNMKRCVPTTSLPDVVTKTQGCTVTYLTGRCPTCCQA